MMRNGTGRAIRIVAAASLTALALGACRDRTPQPPAQPPAAPPAPARPEITLRLPDQPPWNDSDTLTVTVQNNGITPVAGATLELFIASGLIVPIDSSAASRPQVTTDAAGTRLRFAVGDVAVSQTVQIQQEIRTPPAPVDPRAPATPGQPAAPRPRAGAASATRDKTTRFLIRATLLGANGQPIVPPAEDTLRIRPQSEVAVGGCGNVNDVVVSRYGVGPVRVGMPVEALRDACPEARDTTWKAEGTNETGLVALPGGRRVVAVLSGNTVQRVVIDQPGLNTAAGVGVGAQVGDLRSRFGRMCAGRGEGIVAVWFPNNPGISFGLDTAATKGWTPARVDPDSVPDTVAVGSMWIRRGTDDCPARPGEGTR